MQGAELILYLRGTVNNLLKEFKMNEEITDDEFDELRDSNPQNQLVDILAHEMAESIVAMLRAVASNAVDHNSERVDWSFIEKAAEYYLAKECCLEHHFVAIYFDSLRCHKERVEMEENADEDAEDTRSDVDAERDAEGHEQSGLISF